MMLSKVNGWLNLSFILFKNFSKGSCLDAWNEKGRQKHIYFFIYAADVLLF